MGDALKITAVAVAAAVCAVVVKKNAREVGLLLSLTAGAPYGTTEMAAMHVYEKAFTSRQFGVGQAEALILFVIVAIISGIQVYLTKRQEVEA